MKQGYSSRKLQTTFRKFYGRHTYLGHKFDTSVPHMLKGMTSVLVNRDGCHMSGVHDFTHSLYIHYRICLSMDDVYGLMTLVCLPGLVLTALSWTYFIDKQRLYKI